MKKAMWIISIIPMIVTAIVYRYLPERVPMHYNFAGEIDRWGSPSEEFIFPVVILFMSLFWHLFVNYYEKKIKSGKCSEKEAAECATNAKVLAMVGISQAVLFGIMHFIALYTAYDAVAANATHMTIDFVQITNVLIGLMFVVFGNIMPKSKKNHAVGARTTWSMYNDNTWRKTNRFAGIALVIIGLATIITALVTNGNVSTILMLVYLFVSTIAIVIYSKKAYDVEKVGESKEK